MRLRRRKGLGSGRATDDPAGRREQGPGRGGGTPTGDGSWRAAISGALRFLASPEGRWARTALVALVCFWAGWLVAARWVFPAAGEEDRGRLVRLPELVGLALPEARDRAREAGLQAEVAAWIRHLEADSGRVVAQTPLPGQLARAGTPVRLAAGLGPEMRHIPDLRGLSAREATLVLERLGLAVETEVVPSGTGQAGAQGTRPPAGERVVLPAEVELLVGEGPQVVVVPDLRGRHIDDVEGLLNDVGLQLGTVRFDGEAESAPGRVVGQSPPAGYSLRGGGFVSVEVAGRPGEVVPSSPESGTILPGPDGAEAGATPEPPS